MPMVRMDISTIIVAGGPVPSLIILQERHPGSDGGATQLPIRIGRVEAAAIGSAAERSAHARPMTHDLFTSVIEKAGLYISRIAITGVQDTTFYAQIHFVDQQQQHFSVDARPSDAIALAVRCKAPIFADESVLNTAALPEFDKTIQQEYELEQFRSFVSELNPEDFKDPDSL